MGVVGAIAVVAMDESYESVLSAMSLRDYISTELGVHLPLMVRLTGVILHTCEISVGHVR